MQRIVKALAAVMLLTAVFLVAGCDGPKNNNNGEAQQTKPEVTQEVDNGTSVDGHEFVDLGLPSGTLWATCNVGADTPDGYGDYFAWGETEPKTIYSLDTYKYSTIDDRLAALIEEENDEDEPGPPARYLYPIFTKYCLVPKSGYNGFTDDLTVLQPNDDAATVNWGKGWCMPTNEQWAELYNCIPNKLVTQNDVTGLLFTAPNGNTLFLPVAGEHDDEGLFEEEEAGLRHENLGRYWSKSLYVSSPFSAWHLYIYSFGNRDVRGGDRWCGFPVRPVCSIKKAVKVDGEEHAQAHTFVDLGLPSGTLWADCNIGADSPESYGDFFAWGETEPKYIFRWDNYKYCHFENNELTKYCNDTSYGCNGFTDGLYILQKDDDAAKVNWGSEWSVPNDGQWMELYQNTTSAWTTQNGVEGQLFTAPNGNSIFLPAGGIRRDVERSKSGYHGVYGEYWSNSFNQRHSEDAHSFRMDSYDSKLFISARQNGLLIRPVQYAADDKHEYVDLGLPSGTLWATCNVGATAPEEHGVKVAWGEIAPKEAYEWYNYNYCRGEINSFIKYCLDATGGYNGFVDSLTVLLPEDDAATANWGRGWCMPTAEQWRELRKNTTMTWVKSQDFNQGILFTAANGNSLFLPATNSMDDEFPGPSVEGAYWSKTLNDSGAGHPWVFVFNCATEYNVFYDVDRCGGFSVRPVRSASKK